MTEAMTAREGDAMELRHCSNHPRCIGPHLIVDHASKCPDGKMEDCDNDSCWVPCPYCVSDTETVVFNG